MHPNSEAMAISRRALRVAACIAVAVLVVICACLLLQGEAAAGGGKTSLPGGGPGGPGTPQSTATPVPGPETRTVPAPAGAVTTRAPTLAPTPTQRPVAFTLDAGAPVSCGLTCRETTATITNTGDETAHSVCVVIELFNDANERIPINSGPSVERCIGDMAGGSSRTETVQVNADCGFLATRCVGHTLVLKTRVTSLEKTVQFPDTFISV